MLTPTGTIITFPCRNTDRAASSYIYYKIAMLATHSVHNTPTLAHVDDRHNLSILYYIYDSNHSFCKDPHFQLLPVVEFLVTLDKL
jgi:hypothetical protein